MSEAKKGKIVIVVASARTLFGEGWDVCILENSAKPSAVFMCTWGSKNV